MGLLAEDAAALLGLRLTPAQIAAFERYAAELASWNAHTNLTAITDAEGVRVRHFLDSLTVVKAATLSDGTRVIDVGTGAGFPGLPLKIAFPAIELTLLEATGKKVRFLEHMRAVLGIEAVVLYARAEEAARQPELRESYDLVLARAVARLPTLLEYLLPLARVGGRCIAMKGHTAHAEVEDSARALSVLGGRLAGIFSVELPAIAEARYLVAIDKIAPTPAAYPRKPGTPSQRPL
ncbi:MAG: 16S rRNA (guanine(527)-N(7))-methyltransferase RsmG [Aggregatilineales bacterium]